MGRQNRISIALLDSWLNNRITLTDLYNSLCKRKSHFTAFLYLKRKANSNYTSILTIFISRNVKPCRTEFISHIKERVNKEFCAVRYYGYTFFTRCGVDVYWKKSRKLVENIKSEEKFLS